MELRPQTYHYEKANYALDRFVRGEDTILIRPIDFTNFPGDGFTVNIWVEAPPPKLSKEGALDSFNKGVTEYQKIRSAWPKLDKLLKVYPPKIYLKHDYGGGSIRLGEVKEGGQLSLYLNFWNT